MRRSPRPKYFTLSQLLEAHGRGLHNKAIAELLGCGQYIVNHWLKALALKRNSCRRPAETTEAGKRRLRLHELGFSLQEIAAVEGVTREAVRSMLSRCSDGFCTKQKMHDSIAERLRVFASMGMTTKEASEHLGISYGSTNSVARRYGISLKPASRAIPATQEMIDYYLEVKSTTKVGGRFGIRQTVAWKRLNRAGVVIPGKGRRKQEVGS